MAVASLVKVDSHAKYGWNLTANIFGKVNTISTITHYRGGDILHAEFTATKTIGNWTFGLIAYYAGQVSDDVGGVFRAEKRASAGGTAETLPGGKPAGGVPAAWST